MSSWVYCDNCKQFVLEDELEREYEHHSELSGMGGVTCETFYVCPHCGSDEIDDAYECEICGEPTTSLDYCDDCRTEVVKSFNKWLEKTAGELHTNTSKIKDLLYYEDIF